MEKIIVTIPSADKEIGCCNELFVAYTYHALMMQDPAKAQAYIEAVRVEYSLSDPFDGIGLNRLQDAAEVLGVEYR